jgi:hypothetical protein
MRKIVAQTAVARVPATLRAQGDGAHARHGRDLRELRRRFSEQGNVDAEESTAEAARPPHDRGDDSKEVVESHSVLDPNVHGTTQV